MNDPSARPQTVFEREFHGIAQRSTSEYSNALHSKAQHSTVQHITVQHSTVQIFARSLREMHIITAKDKSMPD